MRMQAIGDIIILLPYVQSLREEFGRDVQVDFLTRDIGADLQKNMTLFDNVYSIGGGRSSKRQLMSFLFQVYPQLATRKYDIIFDLQNNRLSHIILSLLRKRAYSIFDRTSSQYAGDRYKNTINSLNVVNVQFKKFDCFKSYDRNELIRKFSLDKNYKYIVVNPGGAYENRNWPTNYYAEFCRMWIQSNSDSRILLLGDSRIKSQAEYLKQQLGNYVIDLTNQTSQVEAMQLLKETHLVVSDDSGLLHMAYVCGTTSIGILGSTRNDWTNPQLPHTYFFNSSDLPCGDCMREKCIHDEIICLTRIKPEDVFRKAMELTISSSVQVQV